jgi:hypothetical protein
MRSAFLRWIVAVAGAAAAWSAGSLPSTAQSKDEQLFVGGMDLKTVLFGSLDAGRSTFLTVGAKQTFTGPLDRSGLVSLVTVGYGGSPGQAGSENDSDTVVRPTIQAGALDV